MIKRMGFENQQNDGQMKKTKNTILFFLAGVNLTTLLTTKP